MLFNSIEGEKIRYGFTNRITVQILSILTRSVQQQLTALAHYQRKNPQVEIDIRQILCVRSISVLAELFSRPVSKSFLWT